ncbi:hypothetical protein HNY73_017129 [Argiope bruennichi]|uniref:Uncharacterized protein n=1 Tax=Argiope bruennichi TaxID=94029 RepID=A0A8T0EL19_ARGBR|nr:hypothetical protein HNY73_017129 [Argiope bruennichi]
MDAETSQHCHCNERLFLEQQIEFHKIQTEGLTNAIHHYIKNGFDTDHGDFTSMQKKNHQDALERIGALSGELTLLPNCCDNIDRARVDNQATFTLSSKRKTARSTQENPATPIKQIETSNKYAPPEKINVQTEETVIPTRKPLPIMLKFSVEYPQILHQIKKVCGPTENRMKKICGRKLSKWNIYAAKSVNYIDYEPEESIDKDSIDDHLQQQPSNCRIVAN